MSKVLSILDNLAWLAIACTVISQGWLPHNSWQFWAIGVSLAIIATVAEEKGRAKRVRGRWL